MKTITAIIIAIMLTAMCVTACADLYPETAKVIDVTYDEDIVTVVIFTGFIFTFYGCEDWYMDDCVSLIMEDNGTELVYDDEIVMAQYGAWILLYW